MFRLPRPVRSGAFAPLLLLAAPLAAAQVPTLIGTFEAPEPAVETLDFGDTIEPLGDVNGDGVPDFAIGGYFAQQDGLSSVGRAYIIDGDTGAPLHTLEPPNPTELGHFGDYMSALGDLNGDGITDFVVGALGDEINGIASGAAYVYDGATGTILYTIPSPNPEVVGFFGSATSSAGDVDGDGLEDILIGALGENVDPTISLSGRVYVFSGADGALLRTIGYDFPPDPFSRSYFGREIYLVDDLDGDGLRDHAVFTRFQRQGRLNFFSAADGSTIDAVEESFETGAGEFGQALLLMPDFDGDGIQEMLIAAPQAELYSDFPPFEGRGVIGLYDGATRTLIRQYRPTPQASGEPAGTGFALALGGDLDGDGVRDFYAGSPGADDPSLPFGFNNGRVYVFSTATGAELGQFDSPNPVGTGVFGDALATGDLDGDGVEELLVGAPRENDTDGRVYVYRQSLFVAGEAAGEDRAVALLPSAPNPFSDRTTIAYQLAEAAPVTISVYDALGRRVATLVDEVKSAGSHRVEWDARGWPGGAYLVRIEASGFSQVRQAVLTR